MNQLCYNIVFGNVHQSLCERGKIFWHAHFSDYYVTPVLILKALTEPFVHMLILGKKTPETRKTVDSALDAQGQKGHLNSSVIEISSDDDSDDNDSGNDYADDHEDVNPASSFSYPGI